MKASRCARLGFCMVQPHLACNVQALQKMQSIPKQISKRFTSRSLQSSASTLDPTPDKEPAHARTQARARAHAQGRTHARTHAHMHTQAEAKSRIKQAEQIIEMSQILGRAFKHSDEEDARRSFAKIDLDGNGTIDLAELLA